jgi:hypothetical protein
MKALLRVDNNNHYIDICFEQDNILVRFKLGNQSSVSVQIPEFSYTNYPEIEVPDAFYERVIDMANAQKEFNAIYSGVISELAK